MSSTPAPTGPMLCPPAEWPTPQAIAQAPDSIASIISEMRAGRFLSREEKESTNYEDLLSDWADRLATLTKDAP